MAASEADRQPLSATTVVAASAVLGAASSQNSINALNIDSLTHVIGHLSARDLTSLHMAMGPSICLQAAINPAAPRSKGALARALRRHQGVPIDLLTLLGSASARAVIPQLTPPLIEGRPIASVAAELKVLTDRDGIKGPDLAASHTRLRKEAEAQQAVAQALLTLHPHPDCSALFGYLWPTELLASRMQDVHALTLSPTLCRCLQGAQRLDLRVPIPADLPPADDPRRDGKEVWALFDTFGAGASLPAEQPPPRFAFASTAALLDHLCTSAPAASPLREIVLDWGYAVDHPKGGSRARASRLVGWLSALPHLWRLEMRHRWAREGVVGAIAALMGSALALPAPFPVLQYLALSWTGDGQSDLAALTRAGRERLPALVCLNLFRDGGMHRRLHAGELQPLVAWQPGLQSVAHCGLYAPSPGRWTSPWPGAEPPQYDVLPLAREDEAAESVHLLLEGAAPAHRRLWTMQLMET